MNVQDIREEFLKLKKALPGSEVNGTLEIINACFIADENIVFGEVNEDYAEKEHNWYMSQSLNVNDIKGKVPLIWQNVSDVNGNINSNYGWCVFSKDNHLQFEKVVNTLLNDKTSRQALMIYTRPSMHADAFKNSMKDFMCTISVQYLIRRDTLESIVTMRSNDAIFGYKYDVLWQKFVAEKVLEKIKEKYPEITMGNMYWNAGSFHVYNRHFKLIKE